MTGHLGRVLPSAVSVAERFGDDPDPLYPEESAYLERAVTKRRSEFATVRRCVREALSELGMERPAMVPGEAGSPIWPPGVVGSMTHCTGYAAAAVAFSGKVVAVGIDAEPRQALPEGVLSTIALPSERVHLEQLEQSSPDGCWDRLLFCAKESVYKVWYPVARSWLGFEEAHVRLRAGGAFEVVLNRPLPLPHIGLPHRLTGRWHRTDTHLLTALVVHEGILATSGPTASGRGRGSTRPL